MIPHQKIERLIVESGIPYTFLRPAYFMQNFTGNLQNDLINKNRIYLPAGDAKFTVVDVEDLAAVAVKVFMEPQMHTSTCYALTSTEALTFKEMADKLSQGLHRKITFISPNLVQFFWTKYNAGVPSRFIFVLILLHYVPRFQKTPETTDFIRLITGKNARSFDAFIQKNRTALGLGTPL